MVQVDDRGRLVKAAYAALPAALPQTASMAEHGAFAALTDLADPSDPVPVVVDCTSIISAYNLGFHVSCDPRKPTASVWRAVAARSPCYKDKVSEIRHFKAHQSIEQTVANGGDTRDYHGNDLADAHAKLGAGIHDLDHLEVQEYGLAFSKLKRIARHVAQVSALFPTFKDLVSGVPFVKPVRQRTVASRPLTRAAGHKMVWLGFIYRCCLCSRQSRYKNGPKARCADTSSILAAITGKDWGHSLRNVTVGKFRQTYFCNK